MATSSAKVMTSTDGSSLIKSFSVLVSFLQPPKINNKMIKIIVVFFFFFPH